MASNWFKYPGPLKKANPGYRLFRLLDGKRQIEEANYLISAG
jgi:hypothetical protein